MGGVFLCPTPAKARRAVPEKTRRRFRASSHRERVACVNDSTAISWFRLSARSRATRGRSRRWRETTPHREGEKITRSRAEPGIERESSAPRASCGERPHRAHRFASTACVCRSTSVRRHASIDSNHPIEESRSSRPTRRAFLWIPSQRHRRAPRARAPSVVSFRGLSVRPVRSFRPHHRRWSSPFLVSSSPASSSSIFLLASPRFRVPAGRARCRDIGIFIRSFGWTRCSVLRVMTRECTREQATTSYDSRYMECTPRYICGDRLDVSSLVGDDVRTTRDRGRGNETFPSPGDGDDRTTSPSVRVIQPSSRVCLDSFSFRALANLEFNDRTDRPFAAKTRSAPSRVSILGRPRRRRRPCPSRRRRRRRNQRRRQTKRNERNATDDASRLRAQRLVSTCR